MRAQTVTVSSASSSVPLPMDYAANPTTISLGLVISGTGTYKVQHTFDDIFNAAITPTWFDHSTITGKTANADGNYAFPVKAIRLTSTAYTNGSGVLTVIQGRGN